MAQPEYEKGIKPIEKLKSHKTIIEVKIASDLLKEYRNNMNNITSELEN